MDKYNTLHTHTTLVPTIIIKSSPHNIVIVIIIIIIIVGLGPWHLPRTPPFSRLLRHAGGYSRTILTPNLQVYCAEIRTMRKEDTTRLEAFEMRIWRRMEKISWTEHISNEVLKLVGLEEERSLLTIIRTRQRNWMGHIMTGDSLQTEIIEGRMDCK